MRKSMRREDPMRYRPWVRWILHLPRPLRIGLLILLAVTAALPAAIAVGTFIAVRGAVRDTVVFVKQMWRAE